MKKSMTFKKPIFALATFAISASLLLPGAASAATETSNNVNGSYSLGTNGYLANTGWSGMNNSKNTMTGENQDSAQSIFYDTNSSFGYNWAYAADMTGTQSSPAISYGWNWSPGYENAGNFPVQIYKDNENRRSNSSSSSSRQSQMKDIHTSVSYSTEEATGDYSTGYTVFIHNTQWAGAESQPSDIVKLVTSTSQNASTVVENKNDSTSTTNEDMKTTTATWGESLGTVSLDGANWDVYRKGMNSDMEGQSNFNTMNGNVYTFVRTENADSVDLNISDFIKNLLDRNELSSFDYVSGVKFGTDVMSGSGKLNVTNWSITAQ